MKRKVFLYFILLISSLQSLFAQSCAGNRLTNSYVYYGGFESNANNFTSRSGTTDLTYGTPSNGSYEVVGNANLSNGGGYINLAPYSGNYLMNIHTSSNATDRLWYKTISVTPGTTYTFSAWVANTKANPLQDLQ